MICWQLEELERKLDEETKCMNRAEKRLKLALKKLEALKDARSQLTLQDSSSSSSSFQDSSLSPQRLEQEKPGALSTVDSQRFGSMEVAKEMLRSSSSEDLLGDNVSGTGSSSICLHQPLISHDEGSCSSVGTAQSQNEDGIQVIGAQQSPADDMRYVKWKVERSIRFHPIFFDFASPSPLLILFLTSNCTAVCLNSTSIYWTRSKDAWFWDKERLHNKCGYKRPCAKINLMLFYDYDISFWL